MLWAKSLSVARTWEVSHKRLFAVGSCAVSMPVLTPAKHILKSLLLRGLRIEWWRLSQHQPVGHWPWMGLRSCVQSRGAVRMAMRAVHSLTLKSSYHTCQCLSVPQRGAPDPVHTHKAHAHQAPLGSYVAVEQVRWLWVMYFHQHLKKKCCKTG